MNLAANICCKMTDLNKYTAAVSTETPSSDHCHWQLYLYVMVSGHAIGMAGLQSMCMHCCVQDSVCLSWMLHSMASSNPDLLHIQCMRYTA
jgi:hypothetical protein